MKINNLSNLRVLLFNNTSLRQTIFKNTLWLSVGTGIDKLLRLILLIYVARILGATEYGKFTFAMAFVALFLVFYDFGLPAIVIREFARQREREEFYSLISLKILLGLAAIFLILIISFFITPDLAIRKIILILALFNLINGLVTLFCGFFQARQKMEYQALTEIFQAILVVGIGLFFLFRLPSVVNLSYSYLLAVSIALIFVSTLFHFRIFPLKISWQKVVWQKFLLMSWPLALTVLFGMVYNYIDSVMMGSFGQITETGWYNAAYKIINVTLLPMGLISASFYPVLSRFFKESKEKLQKVWNAQMELMIFLALPLVIGGMLLAPKVIYFIYPPSFAPSILAFQILIIMAGLIFLYRPFYDVLIASDQQRRTFWITLAGALINVVLNLILIPKYSLYGAAISTTLTYILILLVSIKWTAKFTSISPFNFKFITSFVIAAISSSLMYYLIIQPKIYRLNVLLIVLIGAAIYTFCLFTLRRMLGYFSCLYTQK